MNTSGVMSPPSIHVYDINGTNGGGRSSSRTVGDLFARTPGPMAVPNARTNQHFAPPPLPPPRYIEDLAAGSDPGWKWGNTPRHDGFGGTFGTSISSSSSWRGSWDHRMEVDGYSERHEHSPRAGPGVTIKSPPSFEKRYDFSRNVDEGYHSLSGSSISSHRSVDVWLFSPIFSSHLDHFFPPVISPH